MALSLDDKLLGEKVHNYCSSSSSDDEASDNAGEMSDDDKISSSVIEPSSSEDRTASGYRGVLEDFRDFKRSEAVKKAQKEQALAELAAACSLTCRSYVRVLFS
ncbi:unnamed protein product [Protopolystoma xenopodis]|uniref:Uncharacterized protein n=1 Tax=Protopolystoma xenopodis TaxID=117903 RepID=A0A448X3C5_9PLAT|nr:unnamed protein product [Protopolystoma xenopodis]